MPARPLTPTSSPVIEAPVPGHPVVCAKVGLEAGENELLAPTLMAPTTTLGRPRAAGAQQQLGLQGHRMARGGDGRAAVILQRAQQGPRRAAVQVMERGGVEVAQPLTPLRLAVVPRQHLLGGNAKVGWVVRP